MNKKAVSVLKFFRGSDAGIVGYLVLVFAFTVLTAGAGLIAALLHLGAGDRTQDAVSKYRKAVEIAENPALHTDAELNGAIKDMQVSLAETVRQTPGANTSLGPFTRFIPLEGRATQNTANKSESFPLTIFNQTNTTGKECGAKPMTFTLKVDGRGLGSVAPGHAVSTSVPKGNHFVIACAPAPFGCPSLTVPVPKYTYVYFFWVCRQGLKPIDPAGGVSLGAWEIPGFDPGMMDVIFADPPTER